MPNELTGVVSVDLSKAPAPHPQSGTIESVAKHFEVTDEASFSEATNLIQSSNAVIARVEAFFEADKSLAHKLHASICEKIRTITAPWRAVRPALEPKMKAYRKQIDEARRLEELRIQREAELERNRVEQQAAELRRQADELAADLRKQGQMRQAKEQLQQAEAKVQDIIQTADVMSSVGVVLPDVRPLGGPGESRPWLGEVTDIKAICLAIGKGEIALEYLTPVRLQADQMRPLLVVDQIVLNNIAKRMGKEDLGIPGARGTRGLSLRFSAKATPVQSGIVEETEGWG